MVSCKKEYEGLLFPELLESKLPTWCPVILRCLSLEVVQEHFSTQPPRSHRNGEVSIGPLLWSNPQIPFKFYQLSQQCPNGSLQNPTLQLLVKGLLVSFNTKQFSGLSGTFMPLTLLKSTGNRVYRMCTKLGFPAVSSNSGYTSLAGMSQKWRCVQDQVHYLQGSVQNANVNPMFKKINNFKMEGQTTKPRMGSCATVNTEHPHIACVPRCRRWPRLCSSCCNRSDGKWLSFTHHWWC